MLLAAFFYTLAINHKHMLLYFAPAFLCTMLGASFSSGGRNAALHPRRAVLRGLAQVVALGFTVVCTCLLVWAPLLRDPDDALQVLLPCAQIALAQRVARAVTNTAAPVRMADACPAKVRAL